MMIEMVRCLKCDTYYVVEGLGCPVCQPQKTKQMSYSTNQVSTIKTQLDSHKDIKEKKNNTIPPPTSEFIEKNPAPRPPILRNENKYTLLNSPNLVSTTPKITEDISNINYLIRRVPLISFSDEMLYQVIQFPWVKQTGQDLEIAIIRNPEISDEKIPLKLLLRFFIHSFSTKDINHALFLKKLTIQEEISLQLSPAYLFLIESVISSETIDFVRFNKNFSQKKLEKPVLILTNNTTLKRGKKLVMIRSINDIEDAVLSFVRMILKTNFQSNLDYSIASPVTSSNSTHSYQTASSKIYKNKDNDLLKISSSNLLICMAHGGIIEKKSSVKCIFCLNYFCSFCKSSFSICPGSISSRLHKFQPRNIS